MAKELKHIDISSAERKIILSLIETHLPNTTVWAYGSRATWSAHPQSDLDLVAFASEDQKNAVYDLKEAFEESDLPFRVDFFVWDNVPDEFRGNIERDRVVLVKKAINSMAKLGDLCTKIGSGATPRGGNKVYLDNGPITLIRSQNIYNNFFSWDGLVYINEIQAKKLSNVEILEGDILLNITGDSVARCCTVARESLPARVNQHVCIIRPNSSKLNAKFLQYVLVSPQMQSLLLSWANSGGTRNALTKSMVETLKIPFPPLKIQKAIAHILGTLDDKIDLNRRMNETLEAMAQAIFKSWFVDFDGCTEFEDSELGRTPKGWEFGKLSDVLELAYGKALKKADRIEGEFPVYGSGGVTGSHNKHLAEGPGIIVGRKGTVGKVYWEDKPFFPIDTVFYVKPQKGIPLIFAYELLRSLGLEDMNTDAAVPGLNRNNAYNKDVCIPDTNALEKFASSVGMLFDKRKQNLRQIEKLISIRDTLLPKLISGELRVDEAEKMVENQ